MDETRPVDPGEYVGLPEDAATAKAEAAGWRVRAYATGSMLTMDHRTDRLNLELDDEGVVIDARVF
jgi:hypothetical protein